MQCPNDNGIRAHDEFVIYGEMLKQNFDIGVEDNLKKRNWIEVRKDYMQMNYTGNLDWGTVFIVAGAVAFTNVYEDFSEYKTLAVDLKGIEGGECVKISIADIDSSTCNPQYVTNLTNDWKTYYFNLADFGDVALERLHVMAQFSFAGKSKQTVCLQNIRYLKKEIQEGADQKFHILICNSLAPGFDIGVAIDSLSASPDSIDVEISEEQMKIRYPGEHDWGCVFIYDKEARPHDFSMYQYLSFDIKGELGNEIIYIGIRDTTNVRNDIKLTLEYDWVHFDFALKDFHYVNTQELFIIFCITFRDQIEKSVYVRNISLTS